MNLLRAKPQPIPLVPVQWGGVLTVVVEANAEPRIWFGRKAPTGRWEIDLAQMLRVLEKSGIQAEGPLDPRQLPSHGSPYSDLEY